VSDSRTPRPAGDNERLAPYVPRLSVEWLRSPATGPFQSIEGTIAFIDVSGFTALTERLASRGKVGAEEVSDLIGGVFAELLDIGYEYGCELLKWGGDAAFVLFREPESAARACRATWLMSQAMSRIGRVKTSLGRVQLGISIGLHRGTVDLYLVGQHHRELVITGPATTAVAKMEAAAESGDVAVSSDTAALLDPECVGPAKGPGFLLTKAPASPSAPSRAPVDVSGLDISVLLPEPTRLHLLGGGESAEHRYGAVGFVEFSGVDDLRNEQGPAAVAQALVPVIDAAGDACMAHGVNFHGTDIGANGGKLLILGGVPIVRGDDEERVLRAVRDIIDDGEGVLGLRAGVNAGRVFMHETGPSFRRIHSFSGDAVNLAARLMGRAEPSQILVTDAVLNKAKSTYETVPLEPFMVKGKAEPVVAFSVGSIRATRVASDEGALEFVGRRDELALLDAAAARTAGGAGNTVEIVAEPGMGKSRLVAEFTSHSALQSFRVPCELRGTAAAYQPFRSLLLDVLGLPDDAPSASISDWLTSVVGESAPELTAWLPLLGDILDVTIADTEEVRNLDPRFRHLRLHDTVLAVLSKLVVEPTIFAFEDVHEINDASRDLLHRLVSFSTKQPWLILILRRPGPQFLGTEEGVERLELKALGEAAAAELLAEAAGDAALKPSDRQQLVARAGGNPLFLRELVVAFQDAGSFEALPDAIEPLLAAQVDRLEPADRRVLRAAAVLGLRFELELLEELVDAPGVLDEALWGRLRNFVVNESVTARQFSHALMRDAAYEGLSFRRRRDLHGRAAAAIERRAADPEDQAELLSLHFAAAEQHGSAWKYSGVAGRRAASVYANTDAVAFYQRALDAARHLRSVPQAEVASVAEAMGDASELTADYELAGRAYADARRLSETTDDRARLLRKTGVIHERLGRYPQALRCYTRGRALAPEGEGAAGAERSELSIAYSGVRYRQGQYRGCLTWAEVAANEAISAWHRAGLAHALYMQDLALTDMGLTPGDQAQRALSIYEELEDLVGQGNVLNNLGVNAYYHGKWSDALDCYRRSAAVRQRAGDVVGAATEENNIAEILSDQGYFDEARSLLETARSTWRSADYTIGVAQTVLNLGRLAARSGESDRARDLLQEALALFQGIGSAAYAAETEIRMAELDLFDGRVDQAAAHARDLLDRIASLDGSDLLGLWVRRLLGVGCALSKDPEGALAHLDQAIEQARALHADYDEALSLAARAVVRWERDRWGGTDEEGPRADAREACRLFAELGVERAIVISRGEPWPGGSLATSLTTRAGETVAT